jgi:hypothetical protein
VIQTSVEEMLSLLEDAIQQSSDPPDAPPLTTSYLVHNRHVGCPRIHISYEVLAAALRYQGPTHPAPIFNPNENWIKVE